MFFDMKLMDKKLEDLHREIGECTRCSLITKIKRNPSLERGKCSCIMIVGIAPGNTETIKQNAFSGTSGTRLLSWLAEANIGNSESEIREKVYFTSLLKCITTNELLKKMFANCYSFLLDQIILVNPKIIVTLGNEPFNILFNRSYDLHELVGKCFDKEELVAPSLFKDETYLNVRYIIPFPHPSGLSRWLNSKKNHVQLLKAIKELDLSYRRINDE